MSPMELQYQGRAGKHTAFSFLAGSVHGLKRGTLEHAFHKGLVYVNNQPAGPDQALKPNDIVRLELAYSNKTQVHPEPLPLDILFEDEHILVLNKAAGMPCHHGLGHYKGHLLNALAHHYRETGANALETGLVQRLDKDTSGLMVVAKTAVALQELNRQVRSQQVHKTYQALVWGQPDPAQGMISAPIGRDPHDDYIIRAFIPGTGGKSAATLYETLGTHGPVSLVEIQTLTGRTHQIRIHMQHIGHALVGDKRYPQEKSGAPIIIGRRAESAKIKSEGREAESDMSSPDLHPDAKRHMLHCSRLSFIHPVTSKSLTFESSLPEDMEAIWGAEFYRER